MERSYFFHEQVDEMQSKYDAMVLVKITHDAGVNLVENPIDFVTYHFGSQYSVFWDCMKLIFGEIELVSEDLTEWGTSQCTYLIPFTELSELFLYLKNEDRDRYIEKLTTMLKYQDDEYFGEFESTGQLSKNCFYLTITSDYGLYSPLLKSLVAFRNEVREKIRVLKEQLLNGLRNVVIAKIVYDRLGHVVDFSLNDHSNMVISRLLDQCKMSSLADNDPLYDDMLLKLSNSKDLVVINRTREGVAA